MPQHVFNHINAATGLLRDLNLGLSCESTLIWQLVWIFMYSAKPTQILHLVASFDMLCILGHQRHWGCGYEHWKCFDLITWRHQSSFQVTNKIIGKQLPTENPHCILFFFSILSWAKLRAQASNLTSCLLGTYVLTVVWEVHIGSLWSFDHHGLSTYIFHINPGTSFVSVII